LKHAIERLRDLAAHPFLDGEAPAEQPHEPRQLGDPDDVLVCDVADEGVAIEGKCVMLA